MQLRCIYKLRHLVHLGLASFLLISSPAFNTAPMPRNDFCLTEKTGPTEREHSHLMVLEVLLTCTEGPMWSASTSAESPGQLFFLTFSSRLPSPAHQTSPCDYNMPQPSTIDLLPSHYLPQSFQRPSNFLKLAFIVLSKSLEGNPFWELKIPECRVFLLPDSLASRSDNLSRTLKSHLSGSLLGSAPPSSAAACPLPGSALYFRWPPLSQETLQYDSQSWCPALKQAVYRL